MLIVSLCVYATTMVAQKQARAKLYDDAKDTLYLEVMKVPIPEVDTTVSAVYLWAHPLRHPKTPGNKYRVGDWVRLDYSDHPGLRAPVRPKSGLYKYEKLESRFIYTQNPQQQQEYAFFYKDDEGELVSEEEFKSITFSKFPKVKKILSPYKMNPPHKGKDLREVYRWQHPNLHVIAYDKARKGYYRYRIALTIYRDPNHPEAAAILE